MRVVPEVGRHVTGHVTRDGCTSGEARDEMFCFNFY